MAAVDQPWGVYHMMRSFVSGGSLDQDTATSRSVEPVEVPVIEKPEEASVPE
jgi:hypothetical protein